MLDWLDHLPLGLLLIIALTLGLAPFVPEPHVWEKLKMLAAGTLVRPIDIVGSIRFCCWTTSTATGPMTISLASPSIRIAASRPSPT